MARRVKKGSYWRTLQGPNNIVEVIKLLEDGLSDRPVLAVRPSDPNQIHHLVILDQPQHQYYRCKKDGSWFKGNQSKAQIQARAMWQLRGATQMFLKALEEAEKLLPQAIPAAEFARRYFTAHITNLDNWRKDELAQALALRDRSAAATKEQAK